MNKSDRLAQVRRMAQDDHDAVTMLLAACADMGNSDGVLLSVKAFDKAAEFILDYLQEGYNKRAIHETDIHTLRSALWLARQAMAAHDVPDAGARSAVDAALLATGGLEVDDAPAALAANYQEEE